MISLTYWQFALVLYSFGAVGTCLFMVIRTYVDSCGGEFYVWDIIIIAVWMCIWPYYFWCVATD